MESIEKYQRASQVHKEAIKIAEEEVKQGSELRQAANRAEEYIRDQDKCGIAFPINLSVDGEAAHRTPKDDDDGTTGEDSVVCIDIGVHCDGYIIDAAKTVDLSGENRDLIEATNQSLNRAIEFIEAGVQIGEVGSVVESELQESGYKPIRNLNGHGLNRYDLHADPTIYNTSGMRSRKFEQGEVVAIEPFGSTGSAKVKNMGNTEIYQLDQDTSVRDRRARKLKEEISSKYPKLPFARRWLESRNVDYSLRKLVSRNVVEEHQVLGINDGIVAQSEHTILIEEDGCRVLSSHDL